MQKFILNGLQGYNFICQYEEVTRFFEAYFPPVYQDSNICLFIHILFDSDTEISEIMEREEIKNFFSAIQVENNNLEK